MRVPLNIKGPVILAAALFCLALSSDSPRTLVVSDIPGRCLHNVRPISCPDGTREYTIDDLSCSRSAGDIRSDLVLSFNGPSREMKRDDTGRYEIENAVYLSKDIEGAMGGGCATFSRHEHVVEVRCPAAFWLGEMDDRGSFTIEFRFMIRSLREQAVFFSQKGYLNGETRGLTMRLKGKKVRTDFHNLFCDRDGVRRNVSVETVRPVETGKWYHFMVSYQRTSGRLTATLDGDDDDTQYITETGKPWEGILVPVSGTLRSDGSVVTRDAPPAYLGRFNGVMDEFRISLDDRDNLSIAAANTHEPVMRTGRNPSNVEGVIVSPVYTLADTGTMITSIDWDDELKTDTFIWMEIRMADTLFLENYPGPRWYRVTRGDRGIFRKTQDDGTFLRGKYLQWRAHLVSSPDGRYSPRFRSLNLSWVQDTAPTVPSGLEVMETGDEYIVLRWRKNVEADLLGYRIYYGITPGRHDGIIAWRGGSRIGNDSTPGNYVEIRLDNTLIEENRDRLRDRMMDYPHLRNTVLYYLSVSAFDAYRPDTRHNHESSLSTPVTGRPFAGSEINR